MKIFYDLEPEVSGHLGKKTIMDTTKHPPVVSKLHFVIDGWMGDDIIECFPVFLITSKLYEELQKYEVTGYELKDVEIEKSDEFNTLFPNFVLPVFKWINISGKKGADFAINEKHKLRVSSKALKLLKKHSLLHCIIAEVA